MYEGHVDQKFGFNTWSQHGEDLLLMNLWKFLGLDKPTYLDLGAHHPLNISNTVLLYKNGARGVNIEANPIFLDDLLKYRPGDKNICLGVDITPGEKTFYIESPRSGLNSLKRDSFANHGVEPKTSITIQTLTLNQIVDNYCNGKFPDFLLTDIEGLDFDVLLHTQFSTKPKVICTEIEKIYRSIFIRALKDNFTYYCTMGGNMFFIANEYYEMCI